MFEGLMMTQMFQAMRKTIQPSGLFGDESKSRSTYEYMLDQAVVEHVMASGKGWGLADSLEKNWLDSQKSASTLS
jgi:Rod binding domain-containing protein